MTSAATSGQTLTFGFDALGRNTSQAGPHGTVSYGFDAAGRRTSMTYPDSGLVVGYVYNSSDLTEIRENPAGSNTLLATYVHDNLGRRTSLTRGNGAVTSYAYDNVSRLSQLVQNLNGTGSDLTLDFTHNPAGEIHSNTRSNDGYSYTGHANANVAGTPNGLNQLTNVGGTSIGHTDNRGNVTAIGGASYGYSSENMLTSGPSSTTLGYDPLNRLHQTAGGSTTRFGYDGVQMVAEYNGSDALQRRYVFGPGGDEPLVWYEGSGTSTRRYFHADERGSVVAVSDASGDVVTAVNRYDEYGNVQGTLTGRFGYTGQAWIPELGMWYYRARMYHPGLRFMQTDPIGYDGGMNLYAYVGNNPVNFTDPLGLESSDPDECGGFPCPVVTGERCPKNVTCYYGDVELVAYDFFPTLGGGGGRDCEPNDPICQERARHSLEGVVTTLREGVRDQVLETLRRCIEGIPSVNPTEVARSASRGGVRGGVVGAGRGWFFGSFMGPAGTGIGTMGGGVAGSLWGALRGGVTSFVRQACR